MSVIILTVIKPFVKLIGAKLLVIYGKYPNAECCHAKYYYAECTYSRYLTTLQNTLQL